MNENSLFRSGKILAHARLRTALLLMCVLVLTSACRKHKTTAPAEAGGTIPTSDGVAGDHNQARVYLDKGRELYRNDEDAQAVEAFQQALKLDPNLAEAQFRLGLAYEALQKIDEAEAAYKKAVESYKPYLSQNPDDAEAHYNLGQTYAGLHLYAEAVKEYKEATRLKDDDSDIYCDLGMALTRLAHYDEAATAFSKSLDIDPENYRAEDGLAEAREGVKRIEAAKKHQEELLKKQKEEELKAGTEGASPEPSPTTKQPQ